MNVNLPHVVTISDMFVNYDVKKLKGKGNIKRNHKCEDKKALAKKIFLRYLYHLMDDFIEGGNVFMFPSKNLTELRFRQIKPHILKNGLQKGAYSKLDYLMSNFKFYEPVISFKRRGMFRDKLVKLSSNFVDKLYEKANGGYKYC